MTQLQASIGIIGGSGLYQIEGFKVIDEISIETPFGSTSDKIIISETEGKRVAFLPRHGRGHMFTPSKVPYKANIWALKSIGVKHIIAVSAVGSLKEEIEPQHFVIPDQIIDRSNKRDNSFFGTGIAGHVGMDNPFCPILSEMIYKELLNTGITTHRAGTYLCIEGPQFSTKAESFLYRSWGASVIGMTGATEAKLAREAEICYGMIAMATDYDCWHAEEEAVTVDMVIANMNANVEKVKSSVIKIVKNIQQDFDCSCQTAAEFAIMTDKKKIPDFVKKDLDILYGKYFK